MPPRSSYAFLAIGPAMLAIATWLAAPDTTPRPSPTQTATAIVDF
ncbi:hypothetical protein [Jannaschia formosa]|nr:hypothetical protein [Jannaschia formosa]